MKAKDLMVGDWVYDTILKGNTKVETLSLSGIKGDFHENVCDENTFEPIPITPWILEKNGFNDNGEGVYGDDNSYFIPTYQSGFDTGTWETHIEPTEGIGDFSGKLRYVHQLQHALRLCGIKHDIIL